MKLFTKTLFKTKSFYVGLITVAVGIIFYIKGDVSLGIELTLLGLAVVTGRDAIEKLVKK